MYEHHGRTVADAEGVHARPWYARLKSPHDVRLRTVWDLPDARHATTIAVASARRIIRSRACVVPGTAAAWSFMITTAGI